MQFDAGQLAALAAILRHGSFEVAAADLGVTPSAVSQRIKSLEDQIGAALVLRGSPCTGTSAGMRLAKHAEDVGLLESQVSRDLSLGRSDVPITLRIAVNADSLATWLVPALAAVPDVLFDLVIDDQDHSSDWLKRGAVSAAITAQSPPVSGCDATPLGALRYLPCASPGFVKKWFSDGLNAASIRQAPCLTFNAKDMLQRSWIAENLGVRAVPPTHFLPSTQAFVDAALCGVGWGMNPEVLVRDMIRSGKLVQLVPDTPLDVSLTWQVSRIMSPALGPLSRAIRTAARDRLIPPAP